MKLLKIFLITLSMLVLILPLLAASGQSSPWITDILAPLVILLLSPLIARLFRKVGIEITSDQLDPILVKIMEIIAHIEQHAPDESGDKKKAAAVDMVNKRLSTKEKELLRKRYGTLDTAVQAAFEQSSTALK